ncbi:AAA family ATPase [Brachybacterium sp. GCM10030267]|uniref:AAA family ATPase n=1 Tax=Brachybacterium sp. GCM10030267 TaxID=3273381 RepID=UPI0036222E05
MKEHISATPTLMLIGGAPGSGKSTLASTLAAERPLALALDIDTIKHSLGDWERDPTAAGLQARRLAVAMIDRHLTDGYDVVLGQYLARTAFLEELESLAAARGARFIEAVLVLDESTLARRLAGRRERPDRPEHTVNDRFVGPADAGDLVRSIDQVLALRPGAHRVDACGSPEETAAVLRRLLT